MLTTASKEDQSIYMTINDYLILASTGAVIIVLAGALFIHHRKDAQRKEIEGVLRRIPGGR